MKLEKTKSLPPIPKAHHNYLKPKNKRIKDTLILNHTLNPNLSRDPKYDNIDSITWFRHKFTKSQIANSVNSLITYPNQHQGTLLKRARSCLFQSPLHLDVKYLFQHSIYTKILKLRELFLDFDRDTNKMMEVGEIETMFKENNIKVTKAELMNLFFKHNYNFQKAKKKKMYLTFHQFIDFCLSKDQEFRLFMRKIKKKNRSNERDQLFFPMNFNALLDYFIIKGEERKARRKINNAIDVMDKVVNSNNRILITEVNNAISSKEDNVMYDDINFFELLYEFEKLFVLTQSDILKKKRTMSAIAQHKLNMQSLQYKECKNIFNNSIKVDMRKKSSGFSGHYNNIK